MSHLPDPSQPTIKQASDTDVPVILSMIRELASYENALDKVEATEESLRRTLTFGFSLGHTNSTGYARTLILRLPNKPELTRFPDDEPGKVVGMALYFNNYSTWRSKPGVYLEDLFVRPEYRKRGYGKMLLQELAREVLKMDGGRLEWSCLKWNEPSLQFYRSLGATEMVDWVQLRMEGDALEKLALGMCKAIQTGQRNRMTGQVQQANGQ